MNTVIVMYNALPAATDSSKVVRLVDLFFREGGKFVPNLVPIDEEVLNKFFPSHTISQGAALHISQREVELYDGTRLSIDDPISLVHENIKQTVTLETSSLVNAYRTSPPDCNFLYDSTYTSHFDTLLLLVKTSDIETSEDYNLLLNLAEKFYTLMEPSFGLIDEGSRPTNLLEGVPGLGWVTFFGPEYVELIGRSKLSTAPCYKAVELQNGGFSLQLFESPLNIAMTSPERERVEEDTIKHLGPEYFQPAKIIPKFRWETQRKTWMEQREVKKGGIRSVKKLHKEANKLLKKLSAIEKSGQLSDK